MDSSIRADKLRLRKEFMDMTPYRNMTILVEVVAFCDPELIPTIQSALLQADVPNRIHFAVCFQDDDMYKLEQLKAIKNLSYEHVLPKDAKGSCYARNICNKMLGSEDFVLRIDSHMRFVKHWDTALLRQWHALKNPKAVISSYSRSWPDDTYDLAYHADRFAIPYDGTKIIVRDILDSETWKIWFGNVLIRNKDMTDEFRKTAYIASDFDPDTSFRKGAFVSGHFSFAAASYDRDVPYDPKCYFTGDEWPYAVRVYTHGYDIYAPTLHYVLHKYCRSKVNERKFPNNPNAKESKKQEGARHLALLGLNNDIDLGKYGNGDVRTVQEYQEFVGMDFRNRILFDKAKNGDF